MQALQQGGVLEHCSEAMVQWWWREASSGEGHSGGEWS